MSALVGLATLARGDLDVLGGVLEISNGVAESLGGILKVLDLLANLADNLVDSGEQRAWSC